MSFHEVLFPPNLSLGSAGGPETRTEVIALGSGFEERNTPWAHSRRRYDAGVAMRSADDLAQVLAFFEARRGRLYGFRWKDWTDYKSGDPSADHVFSDQVIGIGDSVTTKFQLCKNYRSGDTVYCRSVTKPVVNTVAIGVSDVEQFEGEHYTVDTTTGVVTFFEAPPEEAEITAGYLFDVPVRFDTDRLEMNMGSFAAGSVPNIPVIEVRV